MTKARWMGLLVGALALGCASDRAETRPAGSTAAAQPRDTDRGGGANSTASNAEAPSQRPSSAAGTQSPHPTVKDPNDPKYEGKDDARAGNVARPGLEGRPGFPNSNTQGAAGSTAGSTAMGDVKELDEVYGQVTKVSGDEIEVEPAYGDTVKLKMKKDSAAGGQMNAGSLKEGDEVRASYDEAGGDKIIVDLKTGNEATPIDSLRAPDTQYPASQSGTTSGSSSTDTTAPSRNDAGMNSGTTR